MHQRFNELTTWELTPEESEQAMLVPPMFISILQNKLFDITTTIGQIVFTGSRDDRDNLMLQHAGLVAQATLIRDLLADINAAYHNAQVASKHQPS